MAVVKPVLAAVPVVLLDELPLAVVEPLLVEVLPEEEVLLLVEDEDGIVPRYFSDSPSRSCRDPRFCSRSLNCANCVTKVMPSIGWVGS